ncbi:mCG144834, partial [Mus musculus]
DSIPQFLSQLYNSKSAVVSLSSVTPVPRDLRRPFPLTFLPPTHPRILALNISRHSLNAKQTRKTAITLSQNSGKKQNPRNKTTIRQRQIQKSAPSPIIIPNGDGYRPVQNHHNRKDDVCT